MTTIDAAPTSASTGNRAGRAVAGVGAWLTTSDHKRLGRLLVGCGLTGLLGVVIVAGLLGFERIDTDTTSLDADVIGQLFSIFRVGLAFFAVVPVMLGLAVAIVPLQLGARALAFPRLAAAGFWAWFFGVVLVVVSIASNGGPGGGASKFVALFISSYALMLAGLVLIAVALAASVLTTRAPGMNMRRVPLFAWSVLVGSLGLILMLPVAIGTAIYLYVSYRYNREPFGGNYGIAQWLGFTVTQPQTYVYVIPAIGLTAELIPLTARRRMPMRQVMLAGLGLVGVAALAGVTQTEHDLPWSGTKFYLGDLFDNGKFGDLLEFAFFNVLPMLGVVIVVMLLPLALKGGRVKITTPFVFAFFGVGMILAGMAGTILYWINDLALQGTVFEEGAYVYVGYGAILCALGGVCYWGPKLWGRKIADKKAAPLALLGVTATVLAALPYYIAGFADQPAAAITFDYSGEAELWNILVTVGHGLMALTVLAFLGLAAQSFRKGDAAGDDPWNGQTLEWATSSPPPDVNFVDLHTVTSPEPLLDLKPSGEGS